MDLETKFKKETGFDAYADNDLRPKVPSDYYVEWLEEQLTLTDVVSTYCDCDKYHDRYEEANNNCNSCDKPLN
jgi:hypothetical protein